MQKCQSTIIKIVFRICNIKEVYLVIDIRTEKDKTNVMLNVMYSSSIYDMTDYMGYIRNHVNINNNDNA